jgi:uncharacterized glyoxalase superfamily protein PhnB
MITQILPMLAVSDGNAAIDFYKTAFGAELLWYLESGGDVVAGLSVDGAKFFLAEESPPYGTRSPGSPREFQQERKPSHRECSSWKNSVSIFPGW